MADEQQPPSDEPSYEVYTESGPFSLGWAGFLVIVVPFILAFVMFVSFIAWHLMSS